MGSRISEQKALLTDYDANTAYAQAFYTLFANMRFYWEKERADSEGPEANLELVHTVQVTSASPFSGQAKVAANLAIVAAQSGAETILVDAHLHASAIRQCFDLPPGPGLSDLLEGSEISPQKIALCLQPTFVPGLRVLSAGSTTAQGSALLLSPQLARVVSGLRDLLADSEKSSGVAVFHSAPVLSSVDASLVGALTDQTVLAVIMGRTTREQARQAQEQLERAHTRQAGVVMLYP